MTRKSRRPTASAVAGNAAVLGGLTWMLLVPAAELHRRDALGYDGYNRLLAMPLLLFLMALLATPRALRIDGRSVRWGFIVAAVGVALLLAGTIVEFYGVLLQDEPNAFAARQMGETNHWAGSDIGWIMFGLGMVTLLIGGLTAAAGMVLAHHAQPVWLTVFTASLGVGVLAGNLLALQSMFLSAFVLAAYAAGWLAFGLLIRRSDVSGSP